ncbi:unnamed protein product [Allacma fusca]|uniref:DNA polymerase delta catalytic subunit n=1 Tax=Allacma fusca TaxID=39272 RepID=A0A8J2PNN7_9HEXA|nr:unnamed protein product [Allacma fusca]
MYGVTDDGNAVCCHVHGFSPYFYVSVPDNFNSDHCGDFKNTLNRVLIADSKTSKSSLAEPVLAVELVNKINIFGYRKDDKTLFVKITLALPRLIAAAKRVMERGEVTVPGLGQVAYQAYESNVDFETRFMVDQDVVGCNWIELPAGKYTVRQPGKGRGPASRAQIEVDIAYTSLISHAPEDEWSKLAPFRILSFDIECAGRKGIFPEPDKDPVIQIANMVQRQGDTG